MKCIQQFLLAALFLVLAASISSCEKEKPTTRVTSVINKAPVANAGRDTTLILPADTIQLNGAASYDSDGRIIDFNWRQISGANTDIYNMRSAETIAYWLIPGTYQFELEVRDDKWSTHKDTITVTVLPPPTLTSPYIVENLSWITPFYTNLAVSNIYNYVPHNKSLKVFIQRDSNSGWIEVKHISANVNDEPYDYFFGDGSAIYAINTLYINYWGSDVSDTPNVKIEF